MLENSEENDDELPNAAKCHEMEAILPDLPGGSSLWHHTEEEEMLLLGERQIILDILIPKETDENVTDLLENIGNQPGNSEGESILGDLEDSSCIRNKCSQRTYSPLKCPDIDVGLDMGCYSDVSNHDSDSGINSPLQSPVDAPDSDHSENKVSCELKNDNDSGCDAKTHTTKVNLLGDSRYLKISLKRLEEEEWFSGVTMTKLNSVCQTLLRSNLEKEQSKGTETALLNPNIIQDLIKKLKSKKSRRRLWVKKRKLFRCQTCKKMFLNRVLLNKHNQEIKCYRKWKCNFCVGQFISKERLREHNLSKCDTLKVFGCDKCDNKYVFKKNLIEHMTPVCKSSITPTCQQCGIKFETKRKLSMHLRTHRKREYLCEICGQVFVTAYRRTFDDHRFTHSSRRSCSCGECGKTFESLNQLKKHLGEHGMLVMADDFNYYCHFCGKPFLKTHRLKEHLEVHTGEVPSFPCQVCGKTFGKMRNLRAHLKLCSPKVKLEPSVYIKEEVKPQVCEKCCRPVDNIFEEHLCLDDVLDCFSGIIKVENPEDPPPFFEDEKPYVCEQCGSAVEGLENIINHIEICNKSVPVKSEVNEMVEKVELRSSVSFSKCGKSFTTKQSVKRHNKTCLICSGLKPLKEVPRSHICQECGKGFTSFSNLKMHLTFCTNRSTDLEIAHLKVKDENVPKICQRCGNEFSCYSNLQRHFRFCSKTSSTRKRKVYDKKACSYCGKSFNYSYYFRHRKICANNSKKKIRTDGIIEGFKVKTENIEHMAHLAIKEELKDEESTITSQVSGNISEVTTVEQDLDDLTNIFDTKCSVADVDNFSFSNDLKIFCPSEDIPKLQPPCNSSLDVTIDTILEDTKFNMEYLENEKPILSQNIKLEPNQNSNHLNENIYTCKTCGKLFRLNRNYEIHISNCTNKKYFCTVCKFKFKSEEYLKRHMTVHENQSTRDIVCKNCSKIFQSMRSLKRHRQICLKIGDQFKINPISEKSEHIANVAQDATTLTIKTEDIIEQLGSEDISTIDQLKTVKEETPKSSLPVSCYVCKKTLSSSFCLRRHMRLVHKHVDLEAASTVNDFHMQQLNTIETQNVENVVKSETSVETSTCDSKTSPLLKAVLIQKLEEKVHRTNKITDNPSSSNTQSSQKVVQPQVCSDCNKIFYSKSNYEGHLHGNACKLTLTCVLCKFISSSTAELVQHMVDHGVRVEENVFYCTTCGKVLEKRKRLVDTHMFTHSGEKPFKCDECDKSFTRKDGLTRHSAVHSGVLPFSCHLCKKRFLEKASYTRHLKNVHGVFEDKKLPPPVAKSPEVDIEIGESQLKMFFEEKPEIKDLFEKNLEVLESFDQENHFSVQHEGRLVFYGAFEGSTSSVQSEDPKSELTFAVNTLTDNVAYQKLELVEPR